MKAKIATLLFCGFTFVLTAAKCGGESEEAAPAAAEEPAGSMETAPVDQAPAGDEGMAMPDETAPAPAEEAPAPADTGAGEEVEEF